MTRKQETSRQFTNIYSGLKKILIAGVVVIAAAVTLGDGLRMPAVQAATGDVSINATNFPDKEFRNYVKENCDTNKDSKLSAKEIQKVKIVYAVKEISGGDIKSLKGIEYFTELDTLLVDCSLKNLDISKNTKLTYLVIQSTKLTGIDLSKNTKLQYLSCFDNKFTSLNVSHNPELRVLECVGSNLTSLDVSKNKKLVDLVVNDSKIKSLDVSHNPNLVGLECGGNKLTKLDVSHNPKLIELGCSDNKLTKLDVTHNPLLWRLYCNDNKLQVLYVGDNPVLHDLQCSSNYLLSLDLSQNPYLESVYCGDNALKKLTVTKNIKMTSVDYSDETPTIKKVAAKKAQKGDYLIEWGGDESVNIYYIYQVTGTQGKKVTVELTDLRFSMNLPSYIDFHNGSSIPDNAKSVTIANGLAKNVSLYDTLDIPAKITKIGSEAFANCKNLKTATLGKDVKTLGAKVFSGCTKLKTLKIKSTKLTAQTVDKQAFAGITSKTTIMVPKSKLAAYKKLFRKCGLSKNVTIKAI